MGTYSFQDRKEEIFNFLLENYSTSHYINYESLKNMIFRLGVDLTYLQNMEILRDFIPVLEATNTKVLYGSNFFARFLEKVFR